jgi:hypothetical protein
MSRKDQFHEAIKHGLEKEGWLITHDPFTIQITETIRLKIDLGAETTIAAQRDQEKIAVEIKSFITDSEISEFHTALGQYLNYMQALEEEDPDRTLHLAIPLETYNDFFQISFVQTSLKRHAVNVIIYDPIQEEIKQWKNYKNIDK